MRALTITRGVVAAVAGPGRAQVVMVTHLHPMEALLVVVAVDAERALEAQFHLVAARGPDVPVAFGVVEIVAPPVVAGGDDLLFAPWGGGEGAPAHVCMGEKVFFLPEIIVLWYVCVCVCVDVCV